MASPVAASYPVQVTQSRAARLRLLALGVAVLLVGGLVWLILGGDVDAVQEAVASTGAWGPLVYVVLHVVLTLVPVSKHLLAGVAGALFGLGGGIALSWVGSMVAAVVGFAIARRLGREAVASLTGPRIAKAEDILRDQGLVAVLVARLTPIPFTIVNYGAGVSAVSWRDFVVGTAVGVVPGTVAYVAVGASAGRDARTFVLAGAVGAVILVGSLLVGRRMRRRAQAG